MKISYVLAALGISLCVMPISASDRDHRGEHNTAQHARYEERKRDERVRAEHRHMESREARERRAREVQWRPHHTQTVRRDRDAFHQPAGVDHGQKRGWQGRDLPPGQAKKADYDRDRGR